MGQQDGEYSIISPLLSLNDSEPLFSPPQRDCESVSPTADIRSECVLFIGGGKEKRKWNVANEDTICHLQVPASLYASYLATHTAAWLASTRRLSLFRSHSSFLPHPLMHMSLSGIHNPLGCLLLRIGSWTISSPQRNQSPRNRKTKGEIR